eukprot:COSAG04_NODE_7245_length_1160_cov_22.660697_1_plen_20_part_10
MTCLQCFLKFFCGIEEATLA